MASIIQRGDSFRVSVKRKGVRDTGTFDSYEEAEAWGVAREAEIDAMGVNQGAVQNTLRRRVTLRQLLAEYIEKVSPSKDGGKDTVERETCRAQRMTTEAHHPLNTMMDRPVFELKPHHIGAWKSQRLSEVKKTSVAREKTFLSGVLRQAVEWGYITKEENPFDGSVKFPSNERGSERDRGVTDDEIKDMLFAFGWDKVSQPDSKDELTALFWCLSLETAMRLQEAQYLRVSEVDLEARVIRLPAVRCKEKRKKTLALSGEAIRLLKLGRGDSNDTWFDNVSFDVSGVFCRAKNTTNIQPVNGLDLQYRDSRHRALTDLSEKLDPYELAKQAGHNNLKRIMTYYRKTAEEFAAKLD